MDSNSLTFLIGIAYAKFASKSHIRISHQNLIGKVLLIGITYANIVFANHTETQHIFYKKCR